MKRTLATCLLLALCGTAAAAPAPPPQTDAAIQQQMATLQTRMNELASRMAALSAKLGHDANANALRYLADERRGMLGVAVEPGPHGWIVNAVTPGGPAARAGVRTGDIVTSIDGHPANRDHAALFHLDAGKPTQVELARDGKTLRVEITPERMQPRDIDAAIRAADAALASVDSPEFRMRIQHSVDDAMRQAEAARKAAGDAGRHAGWRISMAPWFGLNLAPLDATLGSYFGTQHGVLVLSRNDKQFPGLESGDVIIAVAGKPVARPEDVQRALRDTPQGKPVQLALLRHDKALSVSMQAPAQWLVMPPLPPPPPVAPAAPAAPPPPAVSPLPAPPAPTAPPEPPAPPPSGRGNHAA